jgi:hypothetical protein
VPQSVVIVGEDPALIDFSAPGSPPDMNAEKVMQGLGASQNRLERAGYDVRVLLTKDAETVEAQVSQALRDHPYDVIVIGAGLRILPPMAEQFETLMNVFHEQAPRAKLAFNSQPDDSDKAALRWLTPM